MPDVREVYEMVTKQRPPDPGALERQYKRQHRYLRNRKLGAIGLVAALAIAAAVVVVALSWEARRPQPANPTRFHGWIVYRSGSELVAVDPANPKDAISLGPSRKLEPVAASRDGSRLLLRFDPGRTQDLFVLNADGSRIRLTRDGTSYSGSFSPDGRMVVYETFSWTRDGESASASSGLYLIASTGGTPTLLVPAKGQTILGDVAWSPDGSRIAFLESTIVGETGWGEPIYRKMLSVINVDGTERRVLRDLGREDRSPTGWATGLVWSPDGSRFAFSSANPNGYQIYVVNADGSGLRRLTDEGQNFTPVWSPDGSRIAFACGSGLCTMTADGTNVREISGAATRWRRFVWTRSLDPIT